MSMTQPATRAADAGSAVPGAEESREAPWLSEVVKGAVGKHNICDLITTVKRLMLVEALTRSAGNISVASQLLGISRQGVQQMIDRTELRSWVSNLRSDSREGVRIACLPGDDGRASHGLLPR